MIALILIALAAILIYLAGALDGKQYDNDVVYYDTNTTKIERLLL